MWNFQNGHNLHKLEPVSEAEVTGLLAVNDRKVILAVGWSRLITLYDDSDPDVSDNLPKVLFRCGTSLYEKGTQ